MTRRFDLKVVLTASLLAGIFAVTLLRSNRWSGPPSWHRWRTASPMQGVPKPEDGIYALFDAARAGDAQAYLDCFSGPLREELSATAKQDSAEKFKAYLINQNLAIQGMAVTITGHPNADEARARVEYVYRDHNEVQNVVLKKEGLRWRIISIDGAQSVQPLVPYGSKATD